MAESGRDERLVEHDLGGREAGVHVAEGPFRDGRAHRQLPFAGRGEVLRRPLHGLEIDTEVRDVAFRARVRSAGEQALQRIDGERQLLVRDLDLLERVARELFGVGSDGENRVADE